MEKSIFKFRFLLMAMVAMSLTFVSCNNDDDDDTIPARNIVEFAQNDPQFSLLVEAVVKADLVDALSDGPLTLFAPRNDAFQAFLNAAGTNTVENTPKEVLVTVLTNHVLGGEFRAADLQTAYYETLSRIPDGDAFTSMYINTVNGVTINGTIGVVQPDVDVTNGVIHVVDQVIAPPTVVTFATADPSFSLLVEALTAPGLSVNAVDVLSGNGPFTVFAPTNAAFQDLLNSNPDWDSVTDIPTATLEKVLLYHVSTAGNVRSTDLSNGQAVPTLANETFTIDLSGAQPRIMAGLNEANIIFTDVQAQNGVIHVLDTVILPE